MKSMSYIYKNTVVLFVKQIFRGIAYLVPRNQNLVVFGAWCGDRYADNPKFLAEYLVRNSDLELVWIGKPAAGKMIPTDLRIRFVQKDTFAAWWTLLRAKTWVCCISVVWDLTTWPIEGTALVINTWHGFGIKKNGNNTGEKQRHACKASLAGKIVTRMSLHKRPWTLIGGEQDAGQLLRVSPSCFDANMFLRTGTPTNDFLINGSQQPNLIRSIREKYQRILGIPLGAKIVTYLPTWRNQGVPVFSFYGLSSQVQERWKQMLLKSGAVLVEKHHPRTLMTFPMVGTSRCSIPISLEQQKAIEVYELLLVSDVLISDCSGAYKDFGVLKRPCIHFMYDFEDYGTNCSGYVDGWQDMLAGPMVKKEDDLLKVVEDALRNPRFSPAPGYAKTIEYQHGRSCETVQKLIRGE